MRTCLTNNDKHFKQDTCLVAKSERGEVLFETVKILVGVGVAHPKALTLPNDETSQLRRNIAASTLTQLGFQAQWQCFVGIGGITFWERSLVKSLGNIPT